MTARPPRLFRRHRRRLPLRYRLDGASDWRAGFTGDFGAGGLWVNGRHPRTPKQRIELKVDLPEGRVVSVLGRVSWSKEVPRGLEAHARSGFGMIIESADEDWYRYLADLEVA